MQAQKEKQQAAGGSGGKIAKKESGAVSDGSAVAEDRLV